MSQKEFFNAVITETTMPACDAASKEPGYIKIGFAPEFTRSAKISGNLAGNLGKSEQTQWLPGNFRLRIDGLDCTRIVRIESFTVKRSMANADIGDSRELLKEPGRMEFPNLKITFSAAGAESWENWFQDFVVAGSNAGDGEKRGTLEFLSPDRQKVLAAVEFDGLGIFRLEADKDADEASVALLSAELYCEKMAFIPGKPGADPFSGK